MFPMVAEHLRVLVVEDEPLIRWSIAETLAHVGHDVVEADDAESAIEALADMPDGVDVVLLDYRLPDSADLRLLATIRAMAPHAAVVMMTAHGTAEMTQGALDLGAYRVMDKPFDMHTLEPTLRDAYAATR
jgi:two-component system KDP operon response regulator KdpE